MDFKKIAPFYGMTADDILSDKKLIEKYDLTDLHIHTVYSINLLMKMRFQESDIEPLHLIKKAKKMKYRQIIITDHENPRHKGKEVYNYSPLRGALKAQKIGKKYGVDVIPGQEILFENKEKKIAQHILLFPLKEEVPFKYKTGTFDELKDYCSSRNIKMSLPHPIVDEKMKIGNGNLFYNFKNPGFSKEIKKIDALSTIHGKSFSEINKAVLLLSKNLDISKYGESDAHTLSSFGRAGTLVPKGMGIIEAIEKKKTIPFGINLTRKVAYSWGRNACKLVFKNLKGDKNPEIRKTEGYKVFNEMHGDKSPLLKNLFKFIIPFSMNSVGRIVEFSVYSHRKVSAKKIWLKSKRIVNNQKKASFSRK